jgi:putative toxin-antitoxin system antitoxin component (TIGR02293 family)
MLVADGAGAGEFERAAALLGGAHVLRRSVHNRLDVHELILEGLPSGALSHLVGSLVVLRKTPRLEKAVGMSLRTFQRRESAPARPLSQEQGGRAWKFAELLARATGIFGSQEEAERWLERPAIGLDGRCPIDLLATSPGAELVEDYLTRIEYGVYT